MNNRGEEIEGENKPKNRRAVYSGVLISILVVAFFLWLHQLEVWRERQVEMATFVNLAVYMLLVSGISLVTLVIYQLYKCTHSVLKWALRQGERQ